MAARNADCTEERKCSPNGGEICQDQGTGAAMLPDYMCRAHLKAGRLVEIQPGWGPPPGIAHAMFPARRALFPPVRHLLDFLSENLKIDGSYDFAG